MEISNILTLLSDNKVGQNCEYDPLYLQLEQLAIGVPDSQMGDSVIGGKDPDYRKLRENCLNLWDKTRDLRVAIYIAISSLFIDGIKGFRDSLTIIQYLSNELWNEFYPQLDPNDDNDPTERINILSMISPKQGSYNDPLLFISRFRDVKLIDDKPYTLKNLLDIQSGNTDINEQIFLGEISQISNNCIQEYYDTIVDIEDLLSDISNTFYEKSNKEAIIDFSSLNNELKVLKEFYKYNLSNRDVNNNITDGSISSEEETPTPSSNNVKTVNNKVNISSINVSNRAEALLLLKKSADFFRQTEPTNPVPYLIDRAIRIAELNFIDILNDIDSNILDRVKEQLGIPKD